MSSQWWLWTKICPHNHIKMCTHTPSRTQTHSDQCLCFDRGFRLCPINLVLGLLKTCTSNRCNHHCVWTLSLCVTIWLGWMCLNENGREKERLNSRSFFVCLSFHYVVVGVHLPALPLLLLRLLRVLYFKWKDNNWPWILSLLLSSSFHVSPLYPPSSQPLSLPPTHWLYVEVPMVVLTSSRVTVKEGENVQLSCTTSGVPSPELIWDMALLSNYEVRSHTQTHSWVEKTILFIVRNTFLYIL